MLGVFCCSRKGQAIAYPQDGTGRLSGKPERNAEHHTRDFQMEDCCGFWLDTPDGCIWAVGDSRLMEEQLHMPRPDAMLFDISDSRWHIGLE